MCTYVNTAFFGRRVLCEDKKLLGREAGKGGLSEGYGGRPCIVYQAERAMITGGGCFVFVVDKFSFHMTRPCVYIRSMVLSCLAINPFVCLSAALTPPPPPGCFVRGMSCRVVSCGGAESFSRVLLAVSACFQLRTPSHYCCLLPLCVALPARGEREPGSRWRKSFTSST